MDRVSRHVVRPALRLAMLSLAWITSSADAQLGEVLGPPLQPSANLLPPPAQPAELGPQKVIADVCIIGNESTSSEKVFQLIRTRPGRTFDPQILEQDAKSLKTKGLFRDVRIITQDTDHGMLITFEVFERPTIRYIQFLGDRGISEKSLLKETGLRVGDALNFYAIEEARRKLEELYRSKGYPKAQVNVLEGTRAEDRGVVFQLSEGPLQKVAAVTFTGNDQSVAPDGRLKALIESKPTFMGLFKSKVDHDKIAEDIEKLTVYYRGLGYFRARVGRRLEYDASGQKLTIHFVIDEGERYVIKDVAVVGNQKFSTDKLAQQFQLRAGEYFHLDRMNADVSAIRDLYGGQGYIFADVKADPRFLEEPGELNLVYNIAEGEQFRVGKINVRVAGEFPHTKERVILDRLSFRTGDIIDIREVRASERRLKSSQLFIVNPTEGEPPRIVVVPPDLKDAQEGFASNPSRPRTRGQSPDDAPAVVDIEVHIPNSFLFPTLRSK